MSRTMTQTSPQGRNRQGRRGRLRKTVLACAYFFVCPGLAYGLLTSRLPALKEQARADEAQIGLLLLLLGFSGLVALLLSGLLVGRTGSKPILLVGALVLVAAVPLCGLATGPLLLACGMILTGLGMGLLDVAMNAQGIQIERSFRVSCLAFMHACYSIGGVTGALAGALFAGLELGPFINAAGVLGLYAIGILLSWRFLLARDEGARPCRKPTAGTGEQKDSASRAAADTASTPVRQAAIPLFVVVCGLLSMCCYATEGAVAEWGSLFLYSAKGADESTAALVFAVFSTTTVLCRLVSDRLRKRHEDSSLVLFGGLTALAGMLLVLFAPWSALCLVGYALMGLGLAPIIPILFSRAGSCPGVSPAKASSVVSFLSYAGLLFFPPLLGFVAKGYGLDRALLIILFLCLVIALGSIVLRKKAAAAGR